jgi:nucleotide-binding universal stress UspA family protein
MKTILVPVEDHDQMGSILETARAFAARFGAGVDGVGLRIAPFQAVGAEPIVAVTFPPAGDDDNEALARARERFDTFGRELPADGPRFRWRAGDALEDPGLGALARVYDITVLGRPNVSGAGARMTTLESVLFESGRPILIAPPAPNSGSSAITTLAENVVMSWNCSTEGARTLTAAMPILRQAREVTVLTIDTAVVSGPTGSEVKDYLAANGITANVVSEKGKSSGPGMTILEHTKRLGGDLLIKSAYTQSRLRQMIFGGATSQILSHAELPVFMAN